MNPKAVFLEDKELVKWWVSVVHDSRFDKVCTLAMASLATQKPPSGHLEGSLAFVDILVTFPEPVPTAAHFPSPGLVHDLPKRKTEESETKKA
jgi:hypothetical protein